MFNQKCGQCTDVAKAAKNHPWAKLVEQQSQREHGQQSAHRNSHEKGTPLGTGVVQCGVVAKGGPFWGVWTNHTFLFKLLGGPVICVKFSGRGPDMQM